MEAVLKGPVLAATFLDPPDDGAAPDISTPTQEHLQVSLYTMCRSTIERQVTWQPVLRL